MRNLLQRRPAGDRWWFARWDDDDVFYVDFARPTEVVGSERRYADLYLDLYQKRGSPLEVHDEDEFADAWSNGEIDATERDRVLAAKDELLIDIGNAVPPFDGSAWLRLEAAMARNLPPLTDLPPLL